MTQDFTQKATKRHVRSTSQVLEDLVAAHKGEYITVQEIVTGLKEMGFGLLLMVFAAPTTLPFSPPGFTAVIATPLAFLAVQLILGFKTPWVPSWLGKKRIKLSSLSSVVRRIAPWLKKLEWFSKPRLLFISSPVGERFVGLACLLCALSVALPIPFTNTVPSIGIFLMALGLLERDGLVIMGGMAVGAAGITITSTIILLGREALTSGFEYIKSLF
jgi:hypothetical protein